MRFGAPRTEKLVRRARLGVRRPALFRWLALGALCWGCAGRTQPAPQAAAGEPEDPTAAEQPPEETTADEADAAAQALVNRALRRIAALRKLEPLGPVEARHLTPSELVREVERSLDTHVPPRAIVGTGEMLFGLGAVPRDFDYRASVLSLMGTDLAGLYDPERQLMLLRGDLPKDMLEATLLHELVHALQDQHYGLQQVLEWRDDATDAQSALSALAEGDATSAMLDALLEGTGQRAYELPADLVEAQMRLMSGASHESASVPPVLKRSLISPYVDGLRFINGVRERAGWAGVAEVWARPPATTEQLLHPDKYAANEPARQVDLPPEPPPVGAPGWQLLFHDVWGEQSLRLVFEEWMPTRAAARSASGWGGDRIALFGAGERRAVAWHVVADDEDAARGMQLAFLRGVFGAGWSAAPRRAADVSEETAQAKAEKGVLCQERAEAGPFLAERRGRAVVVVAGIFRRSEGGAVRSAGGCPEALAWARAILDAAPAPSASPEPAPSAGRP